MEWLREYVKPNKTYKEIAADFTQLGLMLDKYDSDKNVLDLEHRMDRSDWLSITGCARDLAAYENIAFTFPTLYSKKGRAPDTSTRVEIKVECPDLVNRFNTRIFKKIRVGESPDWLKGRLEAYGIPSINNVVDITNYVMVELGQPMHAQDLAKFSKREIVIRRALDKEKITTLHGDTIELDTDTFVLAKDGKPAVIGGIVGGADTGVDENTTEIILDAGNYDQVNIRKTSRRLKILNETVMRYDKFLHPDLTEVAIHRATELILKLAGGDYYENVDWYPRATALKKITFAFARLETLSGMKIERVTVTRILKALGYKITKDKPDHLELDVPYFRTDVEVEDDIAADILRINGYDKIPTSPLNIAPPTDITPEIYVFEDRIRDVLVNLGLHEHISDPLVKGNGDKNQVLLQNSLNSQKDALRTDIYETLNPVLENYQKRKIGAGIFEVGKVYAKQNLQEIRVIQVISRNGNLAPAKNANEIKHLLSGLLHNLGIDKIYHTKDGAVFNENTLLGQIKWDSFSLATESLLKCQSRINRVILGYEQQRTEDLSIVLSAKQTFGEIYKAITNYDATISKVEVLEEYVDSKDTKEKAVLCRVYFENGAEIDKIKKSLMEELKSKFDVKLKS